MPLPDSYLQYPMRRLGMDHDRYPYQNLFQRKPVVWPGNARVALVVVPVLEWFPLDMNQAGYVVKVPGGMERPYPDYWNYTTRDYGTRVGIQRIFKVLDDLGQPGSVAINARLAQRHPALLADITRRGWEVVAHGMDMSHIVHGGTPALEEDALAAEALSLLRQASGQRVTGWLSPLQSESLASMDVLGRHGVAYTFDWNNDDLPVRLHADGATLYGMPYALDLNDRSSVLDFNLSNAAYTEQLVDAFTTLWEEAGRHGGRVLTIAAHSWLTGQPHRIRAFREALQTMLRHHGVWQATAAQVLDAYRGQE